MGPALAVERRLESVDHRRIRGPIDLESGEDRGFAQIDLEPRLFRRLRLPRRGVVVVDREMRIAAARGRLPLILAWRLHWRAPQVQADFVTGAASRRRACPATQG